MTSADFEQTIELCLSVAGTLARNQLERDALVYDVGQLRRIAEIMASPTLAPEPMHSHVIAGSARDGLNFDVHVMEAVGKAFNEYHRWSRRSTSGR